MIPRLTFAARVALIIVLSLIVAWIGSIALVHFLTPKQTAQHRPLPAQLTALVQLIEQATPEERPVILRAVTSSLFTARIEPGLHIATTPRDRVPRLTARHVTRYLDALGGRPLSVTFPNTESEPRRLSRMTFVAPVDLQFRIGLKSHETLIVDARTTPVTTNRLGLPLGFFAGLFGAVCGLMALITLHRETKPLARRVAQLLRARMAMLGGISHDVRSFATRLRLRVDQMPECAGRELAIADISDMTRLLDDALLASRAGAGELSEEMVEVDQLVRKEVMDRSTEGARISLTCHAAPESAVVLGDRLALRRILANLIDNALKYGKAARLTVQSRNEMLEVVVDDEGPGIPPDQHEALLEPFVRLETSRNRLTGGAGLGLSIVRNLVEAHRGALAIDSAPGGGARFIMRVPIFRA